MVLVSEIANRIDGIVEGNPNIEISGVCDIKNGQEGKITFLGSSKYMDFFNSTNSSAVIVNSKQDFENSDKTLIRVKNPHLGFAKTLEMFKEQNLNKNEIHPTAVFNDTVKIVKYVSIGPYVIIGDKSSIGENCIINANDTRKIIRAT